MNQLHRVATVALIAAFVGWGMFFPAPAHAQDATSYVPLDMDSLEQLVSPVALYPDAMLAQVLVACTYPDDVAAASQWLAAGNDPSGIANQNWDLSVQGVAQYPDVLKYLASNPDYMNDLGAAFANQQADVMTAVQNLRAEAIAAGNLASNDQIQVVNDNGTIEIIPTDPNAMYVPTYDPTIVYEPIALAPGEVYVPLITWGDRCPVGIWLHHDIDWHDHTIYVGNWGANRPWWHHDSGMHDYAHARPGLDLGGRIDLGHGHVVDGGKWMHDSHKSMPRPTGHFASANSNRGYPAAKRDSGTPMRSVPVRGNPVHPTPTRTTPAPAHETTRGNPPDGYTKGATVNRTSARGESSMHSAPAETPKREPSKPANTPLSTKPESRGAPPPPSARPSAPTRGGASSGYQSGSNASRSSSRGAASASSPPAAPARSRAPAAPARSNPSESSSPNPDKRH